MTQWGDLGIGAVIELNGQRYRKTSPRMAQHIARPETRCYLLPEVDVLTVRYVPAPEPGEPGD